MGKYVLKRLLMLIPVILGVVLIVFTILRMSPNDPIRTILGDMASQAEVDAMREEVGLNDPFVVQFFNYVKNIVTKFDFGVSWVNGHDIVEEIGDRFSVTVQLAILSTLVAGLVGIPLGIICAVKQYSLLDNFCMVIALIFLAIPGFWMALMLIVQFALKWKLFPPSGFYGIEYMVLPVLSEGLSCVAGILRTTRSNMLEVIRQDYIRTARAKGLKERVVISRHALKNALIPVITVVGLQMSLIMGGSILIESIFSIPGIGAWMNTAIQAKNHPVVMSGVLMISLSVCVMNLLVDLSYAAVDPRIRSQFSGGGKKKKKKNAEVKTEGGAVNAEA